MPKLRAAIVGCGSIHKSHTSVLQDIPEVEIAAVCDIEIEKAKSTAEKFGCIAFDSFDSLMNFGEFDILHICTPHYLHAEMAIRALNAKKHVLCEKPMAIAYEDAKKVAEAVKKNGVKYGVCFQNRYNQSSVFIRDLLKSGELGNITGARAFVTWDRDESYYASGEWRGKIATEGGGVLINQSIHTLDLLQWLVSMPVKNIKATVSTKRLQDFIEVEDTIDIMLDFGNDVRGLFYASICYSENSPVFLEVVCENGKVVMSDNILVSQKGKETKIYDINIPTGEKGYWGAGHKALISDFYDCVKTGREFLVNEDAAIVSAKLVDKAYKYARQ